MLACSRSHPATLHPGCRTSQQGASTCTWTQLSSRWPSIWWLGVDMSPYLRCPHCPDHQLDPLGHHALTCQRGGDAVLRHNSLRDVVARFCHRARLGGQLEVGGGTEADGSRSRPADYLVPNWSTGKPAAFDITVTSPLNPISLPEAKVTGGSAARMAEMRKHTSNDPKCRALGWVCIPLAVETYGCWG